MAVKLYRLGESSSFSITYSGLVILTLCWYLVNQGQRVVRRLRLLTECR